MDRHRLKVALLAFLLLSHGNSKTLGQYLITPPKHIQIDERTTSIGLGNLDGLTNFIQAIKKSNVLGDFDLIAHDNKNIHFSIDTSASNLKPQGYLLELSSNRITLQGHGLESIFYGKQTLLQILDYAISENKNLPKITIRDWPDFERRGYMLDISRNKVPTMESLYHLIDVLAKFKINEFQLYTEHTFAYENHPEIWQDSSPMTAEEIRLLDHYCKQQFIDLVPNQNSFGHMENWLKHDAYKSLAECPTKCKKKDCLSPTNPESLKLIKELYAELLPNFSSNYFNIGGDETFQMCKEMSKKECDSIGKKQVYLNYIKALNSETNKHKKSCQFWADMVLKYPNLIKKIPKNMTAMIWGYEASYSFKKSLSRFKESGLNYYVCPGTSTWRSEIGKNHNAFANLKKAAVAGKNAKAKGFMNTNWGDEGHFQPLSVVYPTLLLGASYAWNQTDTSFKNLTFQLNHHIYQDKNEQLAKIILQLGNAYLKTNIPEGNANIFHLLLTKYNKPFSSQYQTKKLTIKGLKSAEQEILEALSLLKHVVSSASDSKVLIDETKHAASLALHSIHLGIARLKSPDHSIKMIPTKTKEQLIKELEEIIQRHKTLWTIRNRTGGLQESVSRLETLLNYYKI